METWRQKEAALWFCQATLGGHATDQDWQEFVVARQAYRDALHSPRPTA